MFETPSMAGPQVGPGHLSLPEIDDRILEKWNVRTLREEAVNFAFKDIDGEKLAVNNGIKDFYPDEFNVLEKARKKLIQRLEYVKENCGDYCDYKGIKRDRLPSEDLKEYIFYVIGLDDGGTEDFEKIYSNVLAEINTTE